jgi:cation diffusion facilitator family transporter
VTTPAAPDQTERFALAGIFINGGLSLIKLVAGLLGNSYALVADAVESLADIVGSAIVYSGIRLGRRNPDESTPYGYGKAEPLAALAVSLLLVGAAIAIAVEAVREIRTPHHTPAWWTLLVLVIVIIVKETLFRMQRRRANAAGSTAGQADAWHHRADAITSIAAFIGISIALIGRYRTGTDAWAPADDWAALFASALILFNAVKLMIPPVRELMDVHAADVGDEAMAAARTVDGVLLVQRARARKSGVRYWIDMHVWVAPTMSVREAHTLAHRVKDAVRAANPHVADVLVHVEPAAEPRPGTD